ncbi:MAG: hypothetical protein LBQ34_07390 [Alphaproteobacteria bacterium]|jgi:hypothetical protein|nr:hypothetical protein [Alphaproteobacteria bacterium]
MNDDIKKDTPEEFFNTPDKSNQGKADNKKDANKKNSNNQKEKKTDIDEAAETLDGDIARQRSVSIEIKQQIESLEKKLKDDLIDDKDKIKDEIKLTLNMEFEEGIKKEIKDTKMQIFTVMAMFFGIFAFISADLSLSRGIFSHYSNDIYIHPVLLIAGFILVQLIFFIFIYGIISHFFEIHETPSNILIEKKHKTLGFKVRKCCSHINKPIFIYCLIAVIIVLLVLLWREDSRIDKIEQCNQAIIKNHPKKNKFCKTEYELETEISTNKEINANKSIDIRINQNN